jgi:hypothetical protein
MTSPVSKTNFYDYAYLNRSLTEYYERAKKLESEKKITVSVEDQIPIPAYPKTDNLCAFTGYE